MTPYTQMERESRERQARADALRPGERNDARGLVVATPLSGSASSRPITPADIAAEEIAEGRNLPPASRPNPHDG